MVRWPWGTPFEQLLDEYQVEWEDDDSLGDVVNDFLDAFFKPPTVDHLEHKTSKWIDDHRESLIGGLKKRNEWPDIRWVVRPEKLIVGHFHPFGAPEPPAFHFHNFHHVSYDALAVIYPQPPAGASPQPIDLMILLRS